MASREMARCPPRGGVGIWMRKGFRGGVGFSRSSIRSICLSLDIACEAFEATERNRSANSWRAWISFCWFLKAAFCCS